MQFEEFNKKIREAAEQHHPAYDEKAWQKMEKLLNKHLPQEEKKRRGLIFFLLFFLLLGGGVFVAIEKPWLKNNSVSQTVQGNNTPASSSSVHNNVEKTNEASTQPKIDAPIQPSSSVNPI